MDQNYMFGYLIVVLIEYMNNIKYDKSLYNDWTPGLYFRLARQSAQKIRQIHRLFLIIDFNDLKFMDQNYMFGYLIIVHTDINFLIYMSNRNTVR